MVVHALTLYLLKATILIAKLNQLKNNSKIREKTLTGSDTIIHRVKHLLQQNYYSHN